MKANDVADASRRQHPEGLGYEKMKLLKNLALVCLTIALLDGIRVIRQSYSEEYTRLSLKSEDGMQIRPRMHENNYGMPIDGSYSINLPAGKYMSTSNIREWLIIQAIFLLAGLVCVVVYLQKERKKGS